MASFNRLILLGNLTRDPELSYTPSNTALCKFGIATNRKWKDRDGNTREDVCFIDCVIFGKQAEVFNQYTNKGKSVLIEGRLTLDRWDGPDGTKRSSHKVSVDSFTFVGSGPGGASEAGGSRSASPTASPPPPHESQVDIPF